jgi:hypothetical protein
MLRVNRYEGRMPAGLAQVNWTFVQEARRRNLCNARPMPRSRREPSPDDRQATLPLAKAPARRATTTLEAIAKQVTDRDPSPVRMPELAAITLRLALPGPCSSGCAPARCRSNGSSRRSSRRSSKARRRRSAVVTQCDCW